MKKLFLATLLMASAGMTQAEAPLLVNADGSALSAICIAAVASREAMYDKAAELGVRDFDPGEMLCNGQSVARFVSLHRVAATATAPAGYVFSKTDNSPVTELCLAAVRSEQEYQSVKARHFSEDREVEAEVRCNGMSVQNFARKYRAQDRTLSLR